jgi:phosphoglycolate phosphatase
MQIRQKEQLINKPFEAVMFDLDGTITDPVKGITNSYLYALEKLGLHEEEPDSISKYMGSSLHLYFAEKHNIPDSKLEGAVKLYREYFSKHGMYENKIYDGIPELLEKLHERSVDIFLVTSKPKIYAKEILKHFNLISHFKNIYGSELTVQNTGKDILINQTINEENIKNLNTIMVGDRKYDVLGAKVNGVKSAAVTYGYGSLQELKDCNPDYIVNSVLELEMLLLK